MTKLAVVVVSFNTRELLRNCLESVLTNLPKRSEVIVVDNASTDGSPEMIKKDFPKVKLVTNQTNPGFAKANNQGISATDSEMILLLNSDTLVQTNALLNLTNFLDRHPKVGAAGANLLNSDGSIQPNGGALPSLFNLALWMWFVDDLPLVNHLILPYQQRRSNYFHHNHNTGWVAGTAMILRRSALTASGLLDENIFMYGEDVELCWRLHQCGWQVYQLTKPKIIHLGQRSGSQEKAVIGEFKGLLYIFKNHYPGWQLPLLRLLIKSGCLLRSFIFGRIKGDELKNHIYSQAFSLV